MTHRRFAIRYLVSLGGIALGLWGALALPGLGKLPAGFPDHELTYPLRAGDVTIGCAEQLAFHIESYAPGSVVTLLTQGGERTIVVAKAVSRAHLTIILVSGLFFLLVNLVVFCARAGGGFARDFYWATLLYGVAILINGFYLPRGAVWEGAIHTIAWVICLTTLPVWFVHMTLSFPRRNPYLDRHPELMRGLCGLAVLLIGLQVLGYFLYLSHPEPGNWTWIREPDRWMRLFLAGSVVGGFIVLFRTSRRLELAREREQMKWFLWGFSIGVGPFVLLRALPQAFGWESPVGREFDHFCEMTIPIAFTLTVIRTKLLDIDIIIRRSLIYTFLAGVMAALYLALAFLIGERARAAVPEAARVIDLIAAAIPVALFLPTRRVIGRLVDRTFFKLRTGYTHALRTLKEAVAAASSQAELGEMVRVALLDHLAPQTALVVLRGDEERWVTAGAAREDGERIARALDGQGPAFLARPNATSRPELESPHFPVEPSLAGMHIAAPLPVDGRAAGWLLLGEKRSERRYVEEDLAFLDGVVAEAARALERLELVQKVAEQTIARARLDEIDRLKSEFLARVSHDLRTPLTSIRWSLENLLDGLAGPLADRQREYLTAIQTSARQLERLVNNLVQISRLETGSLSVEVEPVDLGSVAREVRTGLAPLALSRGIRVELKIADGTRPVRGNREKLYEILANLLENAVSYSPNGSSVEILVERDAPGRHRLAVRDHGPGLGEGEVERIFQRFQQGRPSPYVKQTGFGLGLYVVRSFTEMLAGSVAAANHPEGGAVFTCSFPDWEGAQGAEA